MGKLTIKKKLPRNFISSIMLLISIISMGGQLTCSAQDTKPKKVQTGKQVTSKTTSSPFGPEIQVGDYKIKSPKSFVFKRHDKRGIQDFYLWEASPVNGHGPAKLIVEIAPFHSISGTPSEDTLRTIYKTAIWGMSLSCGLSNFQQTTSGTIPINGLSFAKGRWSGTTKGSQVPWYGFSYVTVASGKLLGIHGLSQDTPLFNLAEEAATTFHK